MSLSKMNLRAAVRGAVGEAASVEFLAFLEVWQNLPDPDLILMDPHSAPVAAGRIYAAGSVRRAVQVRQG